MSRSVEPYRGSHSATQLYTSGLVVGGVATVALSIFLGFWITLLIIGAACAWKLTGAVRTMD